jgi:hypothetical protein
LTRRTLTYTRRQKTVSLSLFGETRLRIFAIWAIFQPWAMSLCLGYFFTEKAVYLSWKIWATRPVFITLVGPQGWRFVLRVNLSARGELVCQGWTWAIFRPFGDFVTQLIGSPCDSLPPLSAYLQKWPIFNHWEKKAFGNSKKSFFFNLLLKPFVPMYYVCMYGFQAGSWK